MLWIEFGGWHTFSVPHRTTELWLRGKGSIHSSWVGYRLLPFHWLQSPACRQGACLLSKFSRLLSWLVGLRLHRPSTVPRIQAGVPRHKDLGQGPSERYLQFGKMVSRERGIGQVRGREIVGREGSQGKEAREKERMVLWDLRAVKIKFKTKCPALRFFNLI